MDQELEEGLIKQLDYRVKEGLLFGYVGKPGGRVVEDCLRLLEKVSRRVECSPLLRKFYKAAAKALR